MPSAGPKNPYQAIADAELCSEAFARQEDNKDELSKLRKEFVIPTKGDLKNKKYGFCKAGEGAKTVAQDDNEEAIYFCGNSLGLQPRRTRDYVNRYLDTWASKGVFGHFTDYEGGLPPWLHLDDATKQQSAKIVGALPGEVVVMETLTANLHLLMSSFYRPTADRWKIIIEGKAFPSDHYAALSQIAHHNLDPSALITIEPPSAAAPYLSTEHILSVISKHAATTALVLLPGIQFYSGQFLDIELITRHCHSNGIPIGWDLAHAVGNVPLKLHDWNVDFAAWCNYKYMNGGPGVIGGLFVHETHGKVEQRSATTSDAAGAKKAKASSDTTSKKDANANETQLTYRPRLSGWWGSDKSSRFAMENRFVPIAGASGFQLSNPSALDMTSVLASLDVFSQTSMPALRARSIRLTAYLEARLQRPPGPYTIITPANPAERGAQLSVLLKPGLLESVQAFIEQRGVVVDERKPDVLRIAPAPLYNSFLDIHRFITIFQEACRRAVAGQGQTQGRVAPSAPGAIAKT
ncbi:pyridoxal phosphate-dependent transferase [Boeremia exigua]|uniref:pyridoxal phosphate-dependent transferase n=1 Tax=Boeremia exigua TaxID=749465 RepID=UPI001E8E1378|nr:pyridoxal phosphate-dependent transferase [Boeremia exigua]KAH6616377.1 pyridoxal phosphate-dependent transferase [Boeremia exigua]